MVQQKQKSNLIAFIVLGIFVLMLVFSFIETMNFVNTQDRTVSVTQKMLTHPAVIYDRYLTRMEINSSLTGDMYYLAIGFYSQLAQSNEIATHVISQCLKYDVPVDLAFAIAAHESGFNPDAVKKNINSSGDIVSIDRGLFQLNSKTFPNVDWFNPKQNATYGIKYLRNRYEVAGSWEGAILLYNAGLYSNLGPSTFAYMKKVLLIEKLIDEEYNSFRRNLDINTVSTP